MGQLVMTIFYGVDPSDVRKQTGHFGMAFKDKCSRETEKNRRKWNQALEYVGNIAGEKFRNRRIPEEPIDKIVRDDLEKKLNATPFDDMVGLEAHLRKVRCLLDFDDDGVKVVAITGPARIDKTTIARALHSRFSHRFQLTCFVDNVRGTYPIGFDDYGLKYHLQKELNILKQSRMISVTNLGLEDWLRDHRVLIILDDLDEQHQLEALA